MGMPGKGRPTLTYLCLLYLVTLRIRQPVISPKFHTLLIFRDVGMGMAPRLPSGYATVQINKSEGKMGEIPLENTQTGSLGNTR